MVELLSPITKNSYTVYDSFSFAEEIVLLQKEIVLRPE